jgi:hypothetical protein
MARVDPDFADHPEVIGLSDSAFRLLVCAWCYQQRVGGPVPRSVLPRLGECSDSIQELEGLSVCKKVEDQYLFTLPENPKKKAARERQLAYLDRKRPSNLTSNLTSTVTSTSLPRIPISPKSNILHKSGVTLDVKLDARPPEKLLKTLQKRQILAKRAAPQNGYKASYGEFMALLSDSLNPGTYSTWFKPILYGGNRGEVHYLWVPNLQFYLWHRKNNAELLTKTWLKVFPASHGFRFVPEVM